MHQHHTTATTPFTLNVPELLAATEPLGFHTEAAVEDYLGVPLAAQNAESMLELMARVIGRLPVEGWSLFTNNRVVGCCECGWC